MSRASARPPEGIRMSQKNRRSNKEAKKPKQNKAKGADKPK